MTVQILFAAGAAGVTALALLARHERLLVKARRQNVLEPVRDLFDDATFETDGAGIPRIEGRYRGRRLKLDLIPDTMTVKRLPQLWLSITALKPTKIADAGLVVLIRPSGNDYYSLAQHMSTHLDPPREFPWECLVRGQSERSRATLQAIKTVAGAILSDPKVKEIAITQRGLRIVYQLAEGKRGQHLLLRQSDFEGTTLEPQLLAHLSGELDTLAAVLGIDLVEKSS
ncbi:MAG: hypothetical protein KDJ17_11050 [Hyphomicrobiaceae bacterium]|nr:hypothetical protein [Hyphomicrobiaceae bacterium]